MRIKFPSSIVTLVAMGVGFVSPGQGSESAEFPAEAVILDELEIDTVWAANTVSFDLHTIGERQFVAYYDRDRMMTVASRELGSQTWQKMALPNRLRWDSHNYVTLGIDERGHIHVSGNMHVDPLVYFRSAKPWDVMSLTEVEGMVGEDESRVTYPKFFNDKDGRLQFSYRSGGSGDGNILVNRFLVEEGRWERTLDEPLFVGIGTDGTRNAYHKFVRDLSGNFHYLWIWRDTPQVETSHQICYATTPDLIHWENAFGQPLDLPFRPDDERVIVDPVSSGGGAHNGRYQVILTEEGTPIVGYVKYDENGLTQCYLARPEDGAWISRQISDWDFRWAFTGGGDQMTIGGWFSLLGFDADGRLVVDWKTEKEDSGTWVVDPVTFDPVGSSAAFKRRIPAEARSRMTTNPVLRVNVQPGQGPAAADGTRYLLKWEAMKKSHGRHAPEVIPDEPVSRLVLLEIR